MSKLNTESCLLRFQKIHGNKYDYSKFIFSATRNKCTIICPLHGAFEQRINHHLQGAGCKKCHLNKLKEKQTLSIEELLLDFNFTHNNLYDYSQVVYINNYTKIKIICNKHGIFEQTPIDHKSGRGCPKCKTSTGENKIRKYLIDNSINFKEHHKFDNCKVKRKLIFDFYLPDYNTCIEFDGKQHFMIVNRSKDENKNIEVFERNKLYDKIKDEYCNNNNIRLLRIPYYNYDNITSILDELL